jgi:Predicted permeases
VFAGVLIEQYFKKIKRFFPGNQLLAFTYASILPVCSCGVIPIVETMKSRVPLRVIITFVIAAPLLNPYIVFLSFSVLGIKYGILRIVSSFLLAVGSGILTELFVGESGITELGTLDSCAETCSVYGNDPFVKTTQIMKKLQPYIFWGGLLSLSLEYLQPKSFLQTMNFSNEWLSMAIMTLIGVPIYVCNGADVLLLKPMLAYTDLSLGAAMVFSLTSSAVCISSIAMLIKFLGKKITLVLLANIVFLSLALGFLINHLL